MKHENIKTHISIEGNDVIYSLTSLHEWGGSDRRHLVDIIGHLKARVSSFISGQIYVDYPEAEGKEQIVELVCKYPINKEAIQIIDLLEKSSGINFRFKQLGE